MMNLKNKEYCEICHKRVNLFNKKIQRDDSFVICSNCFKKCHQKYLKNASIGKIKSNIYDNIFKKVVKKQEKHFNRRNHIKMFKKENVFIPYCCENNKVLKYVFKEVTFLTNQNNYKKIKNFINLSTSRNSSNIILIDNKKNIIASLYDSILNSYLLTIIDDENYYLDINILKITEKYTKISLAIYKKIDVQDLKNDFLIKTNVIKTNNLPLSKRQQNILHLKTQDIVYLQINNNKYVIYDKDDNELGEIPNDIKKYIENKKNLFYIGIVDQIYRCKNGLRSFDIKIIPIEI